MRIQKDTVVTLDYKLQRDNGEGDMIEQTHDSQPLKFIFGKGQMLPDFESNIEGKVVGESFSFGIGAANAYGEWDERAIIDIPIQNFAQADGSIPDSLKNGQMIKLQDQSGQSYNAKIVERGLEKVKVDLNHPMAGVDLYFTIDVREVRDATSEELDHGHVHGPGGHQH
jgi:FKBP-type peptidyl-prolyl cis-trans isomerase SlyD